MLTVNHLYVKLGKKEIIKDISFEVIPNQITLLAGVSGSGKTTLMKAMMRLLPTSKDSVLLNNNTLKLNDFEQIVYVPDQLPTFGNYTVANHLEFMQTFYHNYSSNKAKDLAEILKIDIKSKVGNLSKGYQSKVNLLIGLSVDSEYYLLDEPLSGIDFLAREEIIQLFTTDYFINKGVLMSTHEINEIDMLVDKVLILDQGKIIQQFNVETMRETEGKSITDVIREVYQK